MMSSISLKSIVEGITANLSGIKGLKYIGLYPEGVNRIGNNHPAYVIKFTGDSNANDYHTMLLSSNIEVSILLYTKDNLDIVLHQNIIEEAIISSLLDNPTQNTECIMNTIFESIDRGDYSEVPNNYMQGYYPSFNVSILTFTLIAHRFF